MLRRSLLPILIAIFVAALVSAASRAEPLSNLSIDDVTVTEGGSPNATFTVTLDVPSGVDVTFDYATSDSSASAGDDYANTNGPGVIPAGETSVEIAVPVHEDALDEAPETFNVTLTNVGGGDLLDDVGEATINDNDVAPQLSIANATVDEGADFETAEVSFDVTLDAPSGQTVFVDYSTADGTATQPDDYTAVAATQLVFAPGQTSQSAIVIVNGDTVDEVNETFTVDLASAVNATLGDAQAAGTITDDDPAPALSIDDVTQLEGASNATFTVTMSA